MALSNPSCARQLWLAYPTSFIRSFICSLIHPSIYQTPKLAFFLYARPRLGVRDTRILRHRP